MTRTHGLRSTYIHNRCRCEPCCRANTTHKRIADADRAARLKADPSLRPHGSVSTYTNWGCRCAACSSAQSDRCARYNASRRMTA